MAPKVLILGGTAEAVALAGRLSDAGFAVTTALAGRTRNPVRPAGALLVGGFGGAAGLAQALAEGSFDALVDATHPFAARISAHAAEAAASARVPCVHLVRPPWLPQAGDRWLEVDGIEDAPGALPPADDGCVFLATGRQGLDAFRNRPDLSFLVRLVDPPAPPIDLPATEVILARGPFSLSDELALFRERRVGAVVSKNSGGPGAYAKIEAARALGLPVVMIRRPEPPLGPVTDSVDGAARWLDGIQHG